MRTAEDTLDSLSAWGIPHRDYQRWAYGQYSVRLPRWWAWTLGLAMVLGGERPQ